MACFRRVVGTVALLPVRGKAERPE